MIFFKSTMSSRRFVPARQSFYVELTPAEIAKVKAAPADERVIVDVTAAIDVAKAGQLISAN